MRPCGCADLGRHRKRCRKSISAGKAAIEVPRGASAQIASMAGVSPEIAALYQRKPRARRTPAPPVELVDLGPLEDRDPCADLEVERLLRELAATELLVASLRGHQADAERLAGEVTRERVRAGAFEELLGGARRRIDELERAQIGGARQVERLEAELERTQASTDAIVHRAHDLEAEYSAEVTDLRAELARVRFRGASAARLRRVRLIRKVVRGGAAHA